MDIRDLYKIFLASRIISTDSRRITPGCMFFALKGDNFNGNAFAGEALDKGASVSVVDEAPDVLRPGIIRVDHVLKTLQQLARHHRMQIGLPVLAITGSNGKTTTKELCKAVLSERFRVFATEGNLNNHIGVPLTLLAMDDSTEIGIVEMGANHPGEISLLCDIAWPDYGLITNIGRAHLEGFGGIEGVTKAKGELFTHLMEHEKTLFVNAGNARVRQLVPEQYPGAVWYNGTNNLEIQHTEGNPFLKLWLNAGNNTAEISTRLLGGYNAENVVAAYCVGQHFDIPGEKIRQAIENYQPSNNRSQLLDTGRNKIFMDAYNANPSSMVAAISEFIKFSASHKLLILGEMRELGNVTDQEHEYLVDFLREQGITNVFCIGKSFEKSSGKAGFRYAGTVEQVMEWLKEAPITGHYIFLKGSRSNRLEKLIPLL